MTDASLPRSPSRNRVEPSPVELLGRQPAGPGGQRLRLVKAPDNVEAVEVVKWWKGLEDEEDRGRGGGAGPAT